MAAASDEGPLVRDLWRVRLQIGRDAKRWLDSTPPSKTSPAVSAASPEGNAVDRSVELVDDHQLVSNIGNDWDTLLEEVARRIASSRERMMRVVSEWIIRERGARERENEEVEREVDKLLTRLDDEVLRNQALFEEMETLQGRFARYREETNDRIRHLEKRVHDLTEKEGKSEEIVENKGAKEVKEKTIVENDKKEEESG